MNRERVAFNLFMAGFVLMFITIIALLVLWLLTPYDVRYAALYPYSGPNPWVGTAMDLHRWFVFGTGPLSVILLLVGIALFSNRKPENGETAK